MSNANEALLLIEMQNEWLHPDGKLRSLMADQAQLLDAARGALRALEAARDRGVRVVHAGLRFAAGYPELGHAEHGLRAAIPKHGTFAAGGPGSELAPPFAPRPGELTVQGRTGASAFAGSNLDSCLRNQRVERLVIGGFALHVCVLATAYAAHDLGYDVVLLSDAVAAFSAEQRRFVLDDVVHHLGSHVTVDQWMAGRADDRSA